MAAIAAMGKMGRLKERKRKIRSRKKSWNFLLSSLSSSSSFSLPRITAAKTYNVHTVGGPPSLVRSPSVLHAFSMFLLLLFLHHLLPPSSSTLMHTYVCLSSFPLFNSVVVVLCMDANTCTGGKLRNSSFLPSLGSFIFLGKVERRGEGREGNTFFGNYWSHST